MQKCPRWEDLLKEEEAFERELQQSRRVKEDGLLDLNLGLTEESKVVRISVQQDEAFKGDLNMLLQSFKDVFA